MRLSIALATYNGERFLAEQLQSFLEQTRLPEELVACDDGSTDATLHILDEFAQRASFDVRVVQNEANLGYARNFEKAILSTTGDVVFLSDQDDVWEPSKIERIAREFERDESAQLVIHDLEFCDQELRPIGQTKLARMGRYTDPMQSYVTGMATAVRADFARLVFPVPHGMPLAHDDWLHRCAEVLGSKRIVAEVLARYRRHDRNVTVAGALNRPERSGALTLLANQWQLKPVDRLKRNVRVLEELRQWVLGLGTDKNGSIFRIDLRVEATEARIRALQTTGVVRVSRVFGNLVRGYYGQFSGVKSAMKDLFGSRGR